MSREIPSETDAGHAPVSMYLSERKVYPRDISGVFTRLRTLAVFVLLGLFYLMPWAQWDGRQAVLFDLPARKFYLLGLNFWPQDFFFLALLLIIAGLALFFFTALAGRLWCGYACPQTVWTEVFLWMERWTEGDRAKRIKLDASPWTLDKLRRKLAKHSLWLVFALWTGFTFVGFFTPIRDLAMRVVPFDWGGWETFWVLFYALATWGNAGVLREQVCKYMCPYARFQGAMLDRNTLVIAYDPRRGEPRGARRRGLPSVLERARGLLTERQATAAVVHASTHLSAASAQVGARATTSVVVDEHHDLGPAPVVASPEDLGDCIDCTLCVQVCPTGIDIRNGLQYECIACGACIDACDSVMDKLGYPKGLVRYDTQNAIDGKPSRVMRPRIWIYGTLLSLLCLGWAYGVLNRAPVILEVLRDRNVLYREAANGGVENAFRLKIVNKRPEARTFEVSLVDAGGLQLVGGPLVLDAAPEQVLDVPVTVLAPAGTLHGSRDLVFRIVPTEEPDAARETESRFFAPVPTR
jgi:polyferredoxin